MRLCSPPFPKLGYKRPVNFEFISPTSKIFLVLPLQSTSLYSFLNNLLCNIEKLFIFRFCRISGSQDIMRTASARHKRRSIRSGYAFAHQEGFGRLITSGKMSVYRQNNHRESSADIGNHVQSKEPNGTEIQDAPAEETWNQVLLRSTELPEFCQSFHRMWGRWKIRAWSALSCSSRELAFFSSYKIAACFCGRRANYVKKEKKKKRKSFSSYVS